MANPEQSSLSNFECDERSTRTATRNNDFYLESKEDEGTLEYGLKPTWRQMWDFRDFKISEVWMAGLIELWGTYKISPPPQATENTDTRFSDRTERFRIRRHRRRTEQPEEVRPIPAPFGRSSIANIYAQHHIAVPPANDRRRPRRREPHTLHLCRAARFWGPHQPADHARQLRHPCLESATDSHLYRGADPRRYRGCESLARCSRE